MFRIIPTETIPQDIRFAVAAAHLQRKDTHVHAAVLYRASRTQSGVGCLEYVMARYVNPNQEACSTLYLVERRGPRVELVPIFGCSREEEREQFSLWESFQRDERVKS